MGDTHEETDILPSNRLSEDYQCKTISSRKSIQDKTSLMVKEIVNTSLTLVGKGLGRGDKTRLQRSTAEV